MKRHFAVNGDKKRFGEGWPMCYSTGSSEDGKNYSIELIGHHADEIPEVLCDAKSTAEMISGLLNCYFNGIDASKMDEKKVCRLGKPLAELDIPDPANPEFPF
jgi:hypothetical protein